MHAFLHTWRQSARKSCAPGDVLAPKPYIVSAEVARAFECMDTQVVLKLVDAMLRAPCYMIVKYSEVGNSRNLMSVSLQALLLLKCTEVCMLCQVFKLACILCQWYILI